MSNEHEKLYDKVLFESDRTCCVCRDKNRPPQIHHIDGNHSNNDRVNLTVLCQLCHTLTHSTIPFTQPIRPGQVRMYDQSWRAICTAKVLAAEVQENLALIDEI